MATFWHKSFFSKKSKKNRTIFNTGFLHTPTATLSPTKIQKSSKLKNKFLCEAKGRKYDIKEIFSPNIMATTNIRNFLFDIEPGS